MIRILALGTFAAVLCAQEQGQPLYNVTVVEHTLKAINYQYRSGPTEIDFRGTVLLPKSKGRATVESNRGHTEIDAKVQGLTAPQAFGGEFLTYVLWAISPEGAPHNLGELVANGSNDAHLRVTTDLQAFGLLVTAEPYAAVRQPSNVVVMQNEIRPETIGKIEPIAIRAELLPRGHYVLDEEKSQERLSQSGPKVSMSDYEQLSQIYQAQNALALAREVQADQLAPETYGKAEKLLEEARQKRESKAGTTFVVQSAREAAQTADDARTIALKRAQEDKVTRLEREVALARADAQAAKAELARLRATAAAAPSEPVAVAEEPSAPEPAAAPVMTMPAVPAAPAPTASVRPQREFRARVLAQLKGVVETLDTPRGLVIVMPDTSFQGANLSNGPVGTVGRIAQILAPAGVTVTVEGNTDSSAGDWLAMGRAESVRDALVNSGVRAGAVTAKSLGSSRPTTSNATEAGRMQNRRVEIVISGPQIGESPLWDQSYGLSSRR
jgi:flagellar motor protein MotB